MVGGEGNWKREGSFRFCELCRDSRSSLPRRFFSFFHRFRRKKTRKSSSASSLSAEKWKLFGLARWVEACVICALVETERSFRLKTSAKVARDEWHRPKAMDKNSF